jgi:hypothetical protein
LVETVLGLSVPSNILIFSSLEAKLTDFLSSTLRADLHLANAGSRKDDLTTSPDFLRNNSGLVGLEFNTIVSIDSFELFAPLELCGNAGGEAHDDCELSEKLLSDEEKLITGGSTPPSNPFQDIWGGLIVVINLAGFSKILGPRISPS